jgi:hypothetical protein
MWLIIALIAGAVLPVVIVSAIVAVRIKTLPPCEQPEATRQSIRFATGIVGGVVGALAICGVVIALVLLVSAV